MNCPKCNIPLSIAERQNIEIDFCTQCRGVWLDRGELDKIIERSLSDHNPHGMVKQPYVRDNGYRPPSRYSEEHKNSYGRDDDHHHGKKRKSFLKELFDF